jgi:mannosyltransferase
MTASRNTLPLLVALALTVLAAYLRLRDITVESLWWDEVVSWQQSRGSLAELIAMTATDNYPPLQNLLIHFSMRLLGENELALRLPSALLGTLNVLALYWVGTLVGGRAVGLLAALLLCVSGFHIWYSQEARMYALLALSATLFAGTALWVASRPSWIKALASVIAATALLYSHPFGVLTWAAICLGMFVLLLWRRSAGALSAWRFALLQLLPALLFAPWALLLLGRARVIEETGFWIVPVTPELVVRFMVRLLTGPFMLLTLAFGIAIALLPPLAPTRLRLLGEAEPSPFPRHETLAILLLWGFGPLLAGYVGSLLFEPILIARYLIGSLPALLLLLAIGFCRLPRSPLSLVAFIGLGLAALSSHFLFWPPVRDDFRGVAIDLAQQLRPGDCLLMKPDSLNALSYYYRRDFACISTPRDYADTDFGAMHPQRILVLLTTDEDDSDPKLATLGRRGAMTSFGQTRLLELLPDAGG